MYRVFNLKVDFFIHRLCDTVFDQFSCNLRFKALNILNLIQLIHIQNLAHVYYFQCLKSFWNSYKPCQSYCSQRKDRIMNCVQGAANELYMDQDILKITFLMSNGCKIRVRTDGYLLQLKKQIIKTRFCTILFKFSVLCFVQNLMYQNYCSKFAP